MRLSKKKIVERHREQWNYHYQNPEKRKRDWPRWDFNEGKYPAVLYDCFLCEYSAQWHGERCRKCLLRWPTTNKAHKDHFCEDSDDGKTVGLFSRWSAETDLTKRKALAKQIRDLPER